MRDILTLKEWTVRTARLMVGVPDYYTYVQHRQNNHPGMPIMSYDEFFVERQIKNRVEQRVRLLSEQGIDPKTLNLDWKKVKDSQRDKALREVKASMLLQRISEREAIGATRDEVDREGERLARQQREPFAAVRLRFEKDGTLGRIASHIRTEKTLSFLFEHAGKTEE